MRRNRWWCLHKVAINMTACFSFSLDYFERFSFPYQLWRHPLPNGLQLEWLLPLPICQEGSPFLLQASGPHRKSQASFVRGLPVDCPPCPLCEWAPHDPADEKGQQGQHSQWEQWPGASREDFASPRVANRIISFMQWARSAAGQLSPADISWWPSPSRSTSQMSFQSVPFSAIPRSPPHSGALTPGTLRWPPTSHQYLPSSHPPSLLASVVLSGRTISLLQTFRGYCSLQSIVPTLSIASRALPAASHSWDVHSIHASAYLRAIIMYQGLGQALEL